MKGDLVINDTDGTKRREREIERGERERGGKGGRRTRNEERDRENDRDVAL